MGVNRRRQRKGRPERRVVVHGIRRETPDIPKLARALLLMAQREADAEREAQEHLLNPKSNDNSETSDES